MRTTISRMLASGIIYFIAATVIEIAFDVNSFKEIAVVICTFWIIDFGRQLIDYLWPYD